MARVSAWKLAKFGSFLYVVKTYVFEVSMCAGPSMLPSLNPSGDIVVIDRWSPRVGRVRVGDVVTAVSPNNPRQNVCKRVTGLAGEEVAVAARAGERRPRRLTVPQGHVWLEGDNAANSTDSRSYGPVPLAMVSGRVLFKVWPISELGPLADKRRQ